MIETLIHIIEKFFIPYGGLGIFAAGFIEEVIAPIPSSFVMMAGGFFFLKGSLSLSLIQTLILTIAFPAALGMTLGSLVVYAIGYWGGRPVLRRWGKWLGVSWRDIEKIENRFGKTHTDEILLVALRTIPIVPNVLLSAFCGLIRMNIKKYCSFMFLGSFLRSIVLAVLGWQVGNVYFSYAHVFTKIENVIVVSVVLAIVLFVIYKYKFKRRNNVRINEV